jgi:GTP-binding protein
MQCTKKVHKAVSTTVTKIGPKIVDDAKGLLPIILQDSRFITSVPKVALAPDEEFPEVALVGRSNVGKSSWINCMLGRRNLAKTSNTPGKTRQLNYYNIQFRYPSPEGQPPLPSTHWYWVDLPGYGFAKVSKAEQASWRKEIERFLLTRRPLKCVVHLLDARHGITANDEQMWQWMQHNGLHPLVVITKLDKLPRRDWQGIKSKVSKQWLIDPHFVQLFSAETGEGRLACWERLLEMM